MEIDKAKAMYIDVTNNIGLSSANQNIEKLNAQKTPENQKSDIADSLDRVDYQKLIDQAAKFDGVNTDAVQQAKQEIADGTLDTPESMLSAAENILKYGF